MIVYDGLLRKLAAAGWTTYRLRQEKLISESTITRMRNGEYFGMDAIDTVCRLLDCQPGDILAYVPDEQD